MSTEPTATADIAATLSSLRSDYLPQASWTLGGAFRFDSSLQTILRVLQQIPGLFPITHVAGVMPCTWSLDWVAQRRPVAMNAYIEALETYARMGLGVVLVFDNPFVTEEQLSDPYIPLLMQELYNRDRIRKNAVCVASDKMAERIRTICPKLPVYCHDNRLSAEPGKRTPALYNKLAGLYDRVRLHPADASRPAIYSAVAQPEKFEVVMNDPCLRTCPVRRDHLRLLAQMRREPYNTELMTQRSKLLSRTACQQVNRERLQQKDTCNLTRAESEALHEAGFRRFIIRGSQFRNEMTLLWDILRCLQSDNPEISHKTALIATSAMAEFGKAAFTLPSGLKRFSFSNYE